jgi:hypothetical protein
MKKHKEIYKQALIDRIKELVLKSLEADNDEWYGGCGNLYMRDRGIKISSYSTTMALGFFRKLQYDVYYIDAHNRRITLDIDHDPEDRKIVEAMKARLEDFEYKKEKEELEKIVKSLEV